MKIYFDLDGVLADFDSRYETLFGIRPEHKPDRIKHFYANWKTFVEGKNFETLPLLSNAVKLMQVANSLNVPIEILSSSGGQDYHEEVTRQKMVWLNKMGIPYKANIVPGSARKADYANPWNILIDDTPHVVDNYRKAGGTAILHKNSEVDATIVKLYALRMEWVTGE